MLQRSQKGPDFPQISLDTTILPADGTAKDLEGDDQFKLSIPASKKERKRYQ
jgi:hypothetical protein